MHKNSDGIENDAYAQEFPRNRERRICTRISTESRTTRMQNNLDEIENGAYAQEFPRNRERRHVHKNNVKHQKDRTRTTFRTFVICKCAPTN
ncbi:hypothetical protein PoB_003725700 [Plakobranchus ocellatus]|uniref:Uncharacterized protein n=1 Tax=Plakobranchus ocellatus TaxID=259542 RepID=A0AAV4AUS3_9GAST|nr:hypothetical protein PoB_003725700 [Plakobranchus ocellatus]